MTLSDQYRLLAPLGAGTTGRVWHATTPDGEHVVLKVGRERLFAGSLAMEGLHAALVVSSRLPALRGLGFLKMDELTGLATRDDSGLPCVALELVRGEPLNPKVGTLELAYRVALGTAEALADLHDAGLAHGDVKPANILIGASDVTLVDWGAVCDAGGMSVRGATPRYLGRGDPALGCARARDQLALGLVLAELLSAKVRIAADPLTAARRLARASLVAEISLALTAKEPGARPSMRWVLRALGFGNVEPSRAPDLAARHRRLVRGAYLRLRRDELGADSTSAETAPWLQDVLDVAKEARAMCITGGSPVPAALSSRGPGVPGPLDAERRLRWVVSMVGPAATTWGDSLRAPTEHALVDAFDRLANAHSPHVWTLAGLAAALRGVTPAPAVCYPEGPITLERASQLARGVARTPIDVEALDCIEREHEHLPESLVLDAADALRLSGDLGRARRLLLGRANGDALAAEVLRRSGEAKAAGLLARGVVDRGADGTGRAHAILARLAFDDGELEGAARWLTNMSTAPEHEVAALVAHRRGDWSGAERLARHGEALATSDEQRARLAATRAYVLHPSNPETVRELFAVAAAHAVRAGAVLEEATYRTGEAAASVDLGALDAAESAARRAILLFEDVLAQPAQAARAWVARAALWASIDAEHEALDAAMAAIHRSHDDPRACAYARWAACDALPIGAPKARAFVEAEAARVSEARELDDDGLHASARVWRHAPELIANRTALDEHATHAAAHAALEWWRARAERRLFDSPNDADDAAKIVLALTHLIDAPVARANAGKAMHAARKLATALGDSANSGRFETARARAAFHTLEGCSAELAVAARAAAWLSDRTAPEVAATTPAQNVDLQQLVRALAERDDLDALLARVLDLLLLWTGAERGLVLLSTSSGELVPRATRHLSRRDLAAEQLAVSMSLAKRALIQGGPIVAVDAMNELSDSHASVHALELRSVLVLPLVARGDVIGVVYLDDRFRKGAFGARELAWATTVAPIAAVSIADARRQAALTRALRRSERAIATAEATLARRESALAIAQSELAHRTPGRKTRHRYEEVIGEAAPIQRMLALVDRVAESEVPVLVQGETGTGKELVARAIHKHGPRSEQPFVGENCGALPESLLESVLFGHVRGAFTGAHRTKLGLFEAADKGTLFLDEIGEMSLGMQAKLLRVLEDGIVRPVGSERVRRVDVRLVAATHRDLHAMVETGAFREDLLYRLDVIRVHVPALRERTEDIPLLVRHFIAKHAQGRNIRLSAEAHALLVAHPWPGNVRQLENEIRRALVLCEDNIEPEHLSVQQASPTANAPKGFDLRTRVDHLETELVTAALLETGGNQTKAAKLLGLSRFGLHKLTKRLGLRD